MLNRIKQQIFKLFDNFDFSNDSQEKVIVDLIKNTMNDRYGEENIESLNIEIKEHGKIDVQVKLKDRCDYQEHVMFAQ